MLLPDAPEIVVVGAGPAGLFAVYQLGIMGIRCRVIDAMDRAGGQCAAYYADKPVYDVPGFPEITAGALVERLLKQAEPFNPTFIHKTLIADCSGDEHGATVTAANGASWSGAAVVLATGIGSLSETLPGIIRADQAKQDGALIEATPDTFCAVPRHIFAIGDAVGYAGKLRLMLSAFHEAALMAQAVKRLVPVSARPKRSRRCSVA